MSNVGFHNEELQGFVDRLENLGATKQQIADDISAVLAEAKSAGFVKSAIRDVLKIRKMKPSDREEAESIRDLYLHALGMAHELPLFRAVGAMNIDITAKDAVVEALSKLVPANGSIVVEVGGKAVRLTRAINGTVSATDVVQEKQQKQQTTSSRPVMPPRQDAPDVSDDGAYQLGRQAYSQDHPIVSNPFPFGDSRRPAFDRGWRDESGGDGMDD